MGRGLDVLREISNSPGAAPLHAEFRRGLKDLQDVVLQAFPDSKVSRDEANTIANPTSYVATQERLGREITPERQDMEGIQPEQPKAPVKEEMDLDMG